MSWRPTATKEELFRALLNEDSIILYDTETTGFSPEKCRIIQIAAIKYAIVNGELVEQETYERYILQPFPLPARPCPHFPAMRYDPSEDHPP